MEENGVLAPVFSKQPCYPKCGERTKQQIYLTETGQGQLTETGQGQLTEAWMNSEES